MTLTPIQPDHAASGDDRFERIDLLISRIIDAEDPTTDSSAIERTWDEFREIAAAEPSAWRDLAEAQRDRAVLVGLVANAGDAADEIHLPTHTRHGESLTSVHSRRVGFWGGWAVAAAVGLVWVGSEYARPVGSDSTSQTAGLSFTNPEQAIDAYKSLGAQTGQFVSEVPERILLQASPRAGFQINEMEQGGSPDGGIRYEVIFIRQFVERRVLTDLKSFGIGEDGRAVAVPLSPTAVPSSARPD